MVREVDSSTISGLQTTRVQVRPSMIHLVHKDHLKRTSGDSSDRITAPLVSTWMTLAEGSEGVIATVMVRSTCRGSSCLRVLKVIIMDDGTTPI